MNGPVCQTKFLGVNIDYQAQWNAHLEAVALKLNKSLFLLRRLADNNSGKALKSAYFATFHSQLSYAVLVWGHAPNSKYLFGLQRKAIRVVAGLGFRDDCIYIYIHMLDITIRLGILQFLECSYDQIRNKHLGEKVKGKAFASKDRGKIRCKKLCHTIVIATYYL